VAGEPAFADRVDMYVALRRYAAKGGLMDRLVPLVVDGLVPLLKQSPGFRGYCTFASEDGHIISVSVFDDKASADAANDRVRGWVASNLRDLLPDPPEVIMGEALLHEVSKLQGGGADMFVTVRSYDGVGPKEHVLPLVREHAFLVITGAHGFRGYYTFLDERDVSRGVSVSLFDTREHAMAAQERVVTVMRDRQIAPNPPCVTAGHAAIIATVER
jgi:hypothetical protein